MSIGRIQISRAIERIIKHYLYHGRYPTFQTITSHLSSWLRRNTPGVPSFDPIYVRRKEASDYNKYNQNIEEVHTDLSDAYKTTIQHTNKVMDDVQFMNVERDKLKHDILLLEKEITKLLMLETNVDYKYYDGEVISFEDAHYIDQENSSVSLDIEKQKVTLKDSGRKSSKIKVSPELATFETLLPASRTAALESLSHAFDENMNTSWWEVVKTKTPGSIEGEAASGMRAQLTVLFEELTLVNEIRYKSHHGKPVYTKVEYTTNGSSFHPLPGNQNSREVTDIEVWEFDPITVSGFKFIYDKKEHDDRSGGQYQFYFGAKDISFFKKQYQTEGKLLTYPVSFDSPIRLLSMEALDHTPVGTNIDYEVAVYQEGRREDALKWFPISSLDDVNAKHSKYIEFNTKYYRTTHVQYAESTGEVMNGMRMFRLIKDNGNPIITEIWDDMERGTHKETFDQIKNAKLFRGINQWKRERIYKRFEGEIPLNSTWNNLYKHRPEQIRTDYQPIGNTLSLRADENGRTPNFFRFTTCIYAEEEGTFPLSLSLIQTLPGGIRNRLATYAVYLNQERQKTTHDELIMKFKPGWNEISILYHWGNMQERKDLRNDEMPDEAYLGKFSFQDQGKVRADLYPMTYVEAHALYHNVSPNNRSYFSVHERQIVLNYLPVDCLFQFRYEADVSEDDSGRELLLRANLNRENQNESSTPSINEIRLRIR